MHTIIWRNSESNLSGILWFFLTVKETFYLWGSVRIQWTSVKLNSRFVSSFRDSTYTLFSVEWSLRESYRLPYIYAHILRCHRIGNLYALVLLFCPEVEPVATFILTLPSTPTHLLSASTSQSPRTVWEAGIRFSGNGGRRFNILGTVRTGSHSIRRLAKF